MAFLLPPTLGSCHSIWNYHGSARFFSHHKPKTTTTTSHNPDKTDTRSTKNDHKYKDDSNFTEVHETSTGKTTNTTSNNNNMMKDNSDPPILTWVDDYLPASLQPYARLSRMDKPIGTWLLLWPCYWSTAMAATTTSTVVDTTSDSSSIISMLPTGMPDPYLLSLFTVGAFVMRGAGCTINDLWDRDFDARVRRTADRPLAKGDLTPIQAVAWLTVQLSLGLGVLLSLPHTYYTFCWGAASLPFVVVYPLMKRYTNYPQFVLGLTFNWGAWMGWAAAFGSMDYAIIVPLYCSGIAWTMVYDTIYANQDKEDDASLGLKSTALTFGAEGDAQQKRILHAFAAMAYASWLLSGYNMQSIMLSPDDRLMAAPFLIYSGGVTAAYAHLIWQIQTAELNNPHNLAERFRSNTSVGAIVFASIVGTKLYSGL
jgi:4-hydroxybenzoate polyprenyltransferase